LIILTFFLPFFVVSCGDQQIAFTGFETAFGKSNANAPHSGNLLNQEGHPLTLILISAPLILLVLTFFTGKIKKQSFLFKNILIAAPIFNIFAAVTVRVAAAVIISRELAELDVRLANLVEFRAAYGFIIYISLNAALLALACACYFINIKRE
jgi:hypothetical protein